MNYTEGAAEPNAQTVSSISSIIIIIFFSFLTSSNTFLSTLNSSVHLNIPYNSNFHLMISSYQIRNEIARTNYTIVIEQCSIEGECGIPGLFFVDEVHVLLHCIWHLENYCGKKINERLILLMNR